MKEIAQALSSKQPSRVSQLHNNRLDLSWPALCRGHSKTEIGGPGSGSETSVLMEIWAANRHRGAKKKHPLKTQTEFTKRALQPSFFFQCGSELVTYSIFKRVIAPFHIKTTAPLIHWLTHTNQTSKRRPSLSQHSHTLHSHKHTKSSSDHYHYAHTIQ